MKSIPMIFNTEMVQALLSGIKTVTRRPLKKEITYSKNGGFICDGYMHGIGFTHEETMRNFTSSKYAPVKVGDEIYVRETYQGPLFDAELESDYLENKEKYNDPKYCIYKATDKAVEYVDLDGDHHFGWKPSIHMPKWASRITLKVTGVRVERVSEITVTQAMREGIAHRSMNCPIAEFGQLYNDIYGNWDDNPYVWVIEFEVIKPNTQTDK